MPFRHGFKADANRKALRVRDALGLTPLDPVDPWAVCGVFEIDVVRLSEVHDVDGLPVGRHFLVDEPTVFSAVTFQVGSRRVILHNDTHAKVRQRSNIAHELGHCFLGHPMTPPIQDDGERSRDGSIESEAEFFGGMLLISNEAADHIVRSGMGLSAARTYGVSEVMLNYRLQTSGANIRARRRAANGAGTAVG